MSDTKQTQGANPHCPGCGRSVPLFGQRCGECSADGAKPDTKCPTCGFATNSTDPMQHGIGFACGLGTAPKPNTTNSEPITTDDLFQGTVLSDNRFSRFDQELIDKYFNDDGKKAIEALIASKVEEAENIAKLNGRRLEVYQRWEWATREPNRAKVSMHYIGNLYRRFNDLTDQIIELTGNKNYAHYDMDMKTGKILERLATLQSREQDKVD